MHANTHCKKLLWTSCSLAILAVVILVSVPIYNDYLASQSVQNSVTIGQARSRELGIVLLEITHFDGVTIVPAEAVLNDRNGTFVFVEHIDIKNSFLRAAVSVMPSTNDRSRVIKGLFPGDQIVVKGARRLRNEPSLKTKTPDTHCS